MNKKYHLKWLANFLPQEDVIELSLAMAMPRSLVFCFAVTRIAKEYNSAEEDEVIVREHLEALCRIHFSGKRQKHETL